MVDLELSAQSPSGHTERLYTCSYIDADCRVKTFHIYAVSYEDALLQLEDLKSTAQVDGCLVETE